VRVLIQRRVDGVLLVPATDSSGSIELLRKHELPSGGRRARGTAGGAVAHRQPAWAANLEGIGLETTKVEIERGYVKVDGHMHTAEPHVYAIGDLIGGLMLAHVAAHEGNTAVHEIAAEDPEPSSNALIAGLQSRRAGSTSRQWPRRSSSVKPKVSPK
jgi:hypothetical protein